MSVGVKCEYTILLLYNFYYGTKPRIAKKVAVNYILEFCFSQFKIVPLLGKSLPEFLCSFCTGSTNIPYFFLLSLGLDSPVLYSVISYISCTKCFLSFKWILVRVLYDSSRHKQVQIQITFLGGNIQSYLAFNGYEEDKRHSADDAGRAGARGLHQTLDAEYGSATHSAFKSRQLQHHRSGL